MGRMNQIGKTATKVRTAGDVTTVQYHATVVVEFNATQIILRSGGWQTATTKARMNQAAHVYGLRFYVYQRDHSWYVSCPDGQTREFRDGMTIDRTPEPSTLATHGVYRVPA